MIVSSDTQNIRRISIKSANSSR